MKAFTALTARGQIRRLRVLALQALALHGFEGPAVSVLDHGENTTFQVRGRRPGEASSRFMLRVHREGYQHAGSILSELAWLEALRRDTDLLVPDPVSTPDGRLVLELEAAGVPTARHVVLFRWVSGSFRRQCGPTSMEQVGRLTAALHTHASAWDTPTGFDRLRWDREGMLADHNSWGSLSAVPGLGSTDRGLLLRARDGVDRRLAELDGQTEVFGLIHADLHLGNVLFADGRAGAIDFDDCGTGYHLYDAAVTLSGFAGTDRFEAVRRAYVRGYRGVRPLYEGLLEYLDDFLMARRLLILSWLGSRSDNPTLRAHVDRATQYTVERSRAYVAR